jgi:hypothetical protein
MGQEPIRRRVAEGLDRFRPSFGGMVLGYCEDPQTFGATLRYRF